MGQYIHINLKLIQGDILQFAKNFCEAGAYKASVEIEQFAVKALYDSYYSQYDPCYYRRTEQLLFHSYKRFTIKQQINGSNLSYLGGIDIDNFGIDYYPRGLSNEQIIHGAWEQGLHGRESVHNQLKNLDYDRQIITLPTPKDYLEKIIYKQDFKKNIIDFAMKVAKTRKYHYLKFE